MPYHRQATDAPFGAVPYGPVLRITAYRKDASAARVYPGDLMMLEADGNVATATATATNLVGVAADSSAASTADTEVLIYDHPDQLFMMQDDGDTTAVTETSIGLNCDSITTTGDTTTDRSKHEIDSSSATTVTAQLRLIGLHPLEFTAGGSGFATTTGQQRRWVVRINEHVYSTPTGL